MRAPSDNDEISTAIGIGLTIFSLIICTIFYCLPLALDIVMFYRLFGTIGLIVGAIWNIALAANNSYDISFLFEKEDK